MIKILKKNVKKLYNLPKKVEFCKSCVVSNQRPRISFNEKGICNACENNKNKNIINWSEREKELKELLSKYRKKDGKYDVIVPSSGGKDSAVVAHKLKYKYNMNPLTVTWAPHIYTEIGQYQICLKIHLRKLKFCCVGRYSRPCVVKYRVRQHITLTQVAKNKQQCIDLVPLRINSL